MKCRERFTRQTDLSHGFLCFILLYFILFRDQCHLIYSLDIFDFFFGICIYLLHTFDIYIYWQKCYNKWKHGNGWNSAAVWFLVFDFVQLVLLLYTYKNEIIIVWFECVCILNRSGFLLFIVLFVFIFR